MCDRLPPPVVQTFQDELQRSGWSKASQHWDNACAAAGKFDGTYEREITACKRIAATWQLKDDEA